MNIPVVPLAPRLHPRFFSRLTAACAALLMAVGAVTAQTATPTVLYNAVASPSHPGSRLTDDGLGFLYGTIPAGAGGDGIIYKVGKSGGNFTILHRFDGVTGSDPTGPLVLKGGFLYGVTRSGGPAYDPVTHGGGFGTIFAIKADGSGFSDLYNFTNAATDGANPDSGLVVGADGKLYGGTAAAVGGSGAATVYRITSNGTKAGTTFNSVHPFATGPAEVQLSLGSDNQTIYGSRSFGFDPGTPFAPEIFTIDSSVAGDGAYATLVNLTDTNSRVGSNILDDGTNLYGKEITDDGVTTSIFKIPKAAPTPVVFTIDAAALGTGPGDLVLSTNNSKVYGALGAGGPNSSGSIFTYDPTNDALALVKGMLPSDGFPNSGLIQGQGAFLLFGLTFDGGTNGTGSLYSIAPPANTYALVFSFPAASLSNPQYILDGTASTVYVAGNNVVGSVDKTSGALTVLATLIPTLAGSDIGPISKDAAGTIYGTTQTGGMNGHGAIFSVTPAKVLSVLYSFTDDGFNPGKVAVSGGKVYGVRGLNAADGYYYALTISSGAIVTTTLTGAEPQSGVIEGSTGRLYGTLSTVNASFNPVQDQVFGINKDGSGLFTANIGTGTNNPSPVIEASDGFLYGTTSSSTVTGNLFKVDKVDAAGKTVAVTAVDADPVIGSGFASPIVEGTDGRLYGSTSLGGPGGSGSLFAINKDGTTPVDLLDLDATSGTQVDSVTFGGAGKLFAAAQQGGTNGLGTVFYINAAGAQATTTVVTATPATVAVGASTTFTATVAVTGTGTGTPIGTVTFYDGATVLAANQPVTAAGVATFSTSSLVQGQHPITAVFTSTDPAFANSTSAILNYLVTGPLVNTTSALTFIPAAPVSGQNVTLTATLTPADSTTNTATGTYQFFDGMTPLGTGTVANNIATLTISFTAGTHSLTAAYSGDAAYAISTSAPVSLTVVVATGTLTTTSLTSSVNPSGNAQSVTFTATVGTASGSVVSGTVDFLDGSTIIGTGTLSGNVATLTTTTLAPGTHVITASYNGQAGIFQPSSSFPVNQVVVNGGYNYVALYQSYALYKYQQAGIYFGQGNVYQGYYAYAYFFYFLYLADLAGGQDGTANLNQFYENLAVFYFVAYRNTGDLPAAYAWYNYILTFVH